MLHSSVKVYLINLDRSPDKLANSTNNFNKIGLPFERISAVDGASLDMKNIESFAVKTEIDKNKWITPAVIGCSLSHYTAFKNLLASEAEWGVILEDDVEFSPDIVDALNSAIKVINTDDVFLLYFHGPEKSYSKNTTIKVNSKHSFYAASSLWGGYAAGAYLIHRNLAKRLHDYVFPVHISPDSWGVYHQNSVIGGLWALLPPVSKTANFGSDIGYSNFGKILRTLENRLPFFSIITRWQRKFFKKTDTRYHFVEDVPEWFTARK